MNLDVAEQLHTFVYTYVSCQFPVVMPLCRWSERSATIHTYDDKLALVDLLPSVTHPVRVPLLTWLCASLQLGAGPIKTVAWWRRVQRVES